MEWMNEPVDNETDLYFMCGIRSCGAKTPCADYICLIQFCSTNNG